MGVRKSVRFTYKGQELELFYVGAVCDALGRSSQTVRKWELAGIIPKTPFRDNTNKRLYLQDHIDALYECAERCGIGQGKSIGNTRFKEQVYRRFNEINRKYGVVTTKVGG